VHTQLLAVIADFKLECAGIELGCQCAVWLRTIRQIYRRD
jgi:hypothetical protein